MNRHSATLWRVPDKDLGQNETLHRSLIGVHPRPCVENRIAPGGPEVSGSGQNKLAVITLPGHNFLPHKMEALFYQLKSSNSACIF